MRDLPMIPGLRDTFGGPVRDVLGDPIGASDPLAGPHCLAMPGLGPAAGLPAGTIVRNILGNPVAEVGMGGILLPPPRFGG